MEGHRWLAASFDLLNRVTGTETKFLAKYRPRIVGEAAGRALEVGAGTGASFPYYGNTAEVIATEPDPNMFERAEGRLRELGVNNIELRRAAAESLPFEEEGFDHIVSTMVFCGVRDPGRGLSQVRRVLKPGGAFRFIEDVRYDDGWKARVQDAITRAVLRTYPPPLVGFRPASAPPTAPGRPERRHPRRGQEVDVPLVE